MYVLKAIQIVSLLVVIAAGMQSGESRRLRIPTNICYFEHASRYDSEHRYQHTIVNATGQICYKTISARHLNILFTNALLDEAFANASAEVCSGWSNSKTCLFKHLNSKCSSTEIDRFQEDFVFNYFLTGAELLCEPSENFNLLNFVKETAVDDGIGACITTRDAKREVAMCIKRFTKKKDFFAVPFHEMVTALHQCYIQPIKNCSQGNRIKELRLLSQSIQLEHARFASYDVVWNQFKTPKSPLLDLDNLLK